MAVSTVLRPRSDPEAHSSDTGSERILDLLRYEARPYSIRLYRHARLTSISSRADYVATLELLLGFYRPLDRWIGAMLRPYAAELQLTRRAKAPVLTRDLAALHVAPGALRFQPAPVRGGLAYALGWLYGIEIVSLGGRVVARTVNDRLGIDAGTGGAFFNGYGAEAGTAWHSLTTTLSRRVVIDGDRTAALDGAADMFEAFIDWLSLP